MNKIYTYQSSRIAISSYKSRKTRSSRKSVKKPEGK